MTKTVALLPELVERVAKAMQDARDEIGATEQQRIAFGYAEAAMRAEFAAAIEATRTDQQLREEVERLREVLDIARHELRRQHDGVDFERTKRCRGLIEQLDDALSSSSLTE